MAGTLHANQIIPDQSQTLYINGIDYNANVVIGNSATSIATFSPNGNLTVQGSITANTITSASGNVSVTGAVSATGNVSGSNIVSSGTVSGSSVSSTGNISANNITSSYDITASSFNGGPLGGMRNRIINGDMRIDQRNAGAAINAASNVYTVDRFFIQGSQTGKFNIGQNLGSVTPPIGFLNYLGATTASAVSVSSGDYFIIRQAIEGLNCADLNWGTANAKTVTLSFYVYSSLTGTFSGHLTNNSSTRWYPYTYTVSAANTWTYVSITITGDTTGTWLTTNGTGIYVGWSLGTGSANQATANAWTASTGIAATGSANVVGTNGATFYITGVQLEKGATATPFENRFYGTELALCQRYYWKNTGSLYAMHGSGVAASGTSADIYTKFPVTMRAIPTVGVNTVQVQIALTGFAAVSITGASGVTTDAAFSRIGVSSGLTPGYGAILTNANNAGGYMDASAEL